MKIGFTGARWQQDMDGVWLCLNIDRPNDGMAFLQEMKQGKRYDAELKEHKERRSLDANAYAWVLMDKLAAKTGIAKTDVYRSFIREIGGNNDVVCVMEPAVDKLRTNWSKNGVGWVTDVGPSKIAGCKTVTLYYGSSTYDTKQMARLIDLIVQDCKEQGIETLTPFELDALKERWSCTG
jgi:hypothetical protein